MYFAYLRKNANHPTNIAIKDGFHSKAVEVIYIAILLYFSPLLLTSEPKWPNAQLGDERAYAAL